MFVLEFFRSVARSFDTVFTQTLHTSNDSCKIWPTLFLQRFLSTRQQFRYLGHDLRRSLHQFFGRFRSLLTCKRSSSRAQIAFGHFFEPFLTTRAHDKHWFLYAYFNITLHKLLWQSSPVSRDTRGKHIVPFKYSTFFRRATAKATNADNRYNDTKQRAVVSIEQWARWV